MRGKLVANLVVAATVSADVKMVGATANPRTALADAPRPHSN